MTDVLTQELTLVSPPETVVCSTCHGTRKAPWGDPFGDDLDDCDTCGGTGRMTPSLVSLGFGGYSANEEAEARYHAELDEESAWAEHAEWLAREQAILKMDTRLEIYVHYHPSDGRDWMDGCDPPEACGLRPC